MKLHYYPETDSLYIELKKRARRRDKGNRRGPAGDLGLVMHRN